MRTYSYSGRAHGSASVAALVGMVVTLVIIAGLMTAAMQTVLRGRQQQNSSAARYLAEAGVQYGYWQYIYNGAALPYNGSATLPGGSFTVQVVDNSANLANTIKITATGTHGTANASLARIYNNGNSQTGVHIFDYALLLNQSLNTQWYPVLGSGGAGGDIRANGSISATSSNTQINGAAIATGSISLANVTGTTSPNSSLYSFPTLSAAYYQSIANSTIPTVDQSGAFKFDTDNEIIYVNGDFNVVHHTVIKGTGTIFVSGNININASMSYAGDSHVAFLTAGQMNVNSGADTIVGCYYVHNSSGTATTIFDTGISSWSGSLVTDQIILNGGNSQLTIQEDPFFTATQGKTMRLPGY